MALTFAWRSDTSSGNAWFANGSQQMHAYRYGVTGGGVGTEYLSATSSNVIGTTVLGLEGLATRNAVYWHAEHENVNRATGNLSTLVRYVPDYNGGGTDNYQIVNFISSGYFSGFTINLVHRTTGNVELWIVDSIGTTKYNSAVMSYSATSGNPVDFFLRLQWTVNGNATMSGEFFYNGVTQTAISIAAFNDSFSSSNHFLKMGFGYDPLYGRGGGRYNEFVIWDSYEDPTNITTVTPAGVTTAADSLDGASRTGWVDAIQKNGHEWSSITAAQIKDGVNQVQAGLTQTGTYEWDTITAAQIASGVNHIQDGVTFTGTLLSETWSTITAAQIKDGVNQIQNSVTITGTYEWDTIAAADIKSGVNHIQDGVTFTGSYLWTSITADKIQNGVTQIQDSVTITGSLVAPLAGAGTATVIDIPNLKEQIRWILDQNNTTTSSVLDLSAGLTNRVQRVAKLNPEKIPLQATQLPAVTVTTNRKVIEEKTIAVNQLNGKRRAEVYFTIYGLVWNDNFSADIYNDAASDDLELLMENTERILRSYHDLGSTVKWQFPTDVEYFNVKIDEQTHFRVGFLDLKVTVFY